MFKKLMFAAYAAVMMSFTTLAGNATWQLASGQAFRVTVRPVFTRPTPTMVVPTGTRLIWVTSFRPLPTARWISRIRHAVRGTLERAE